jgi:hypothetical protein
MKMEDSLRRLLHCLAMLLVLTPVSPAADVHSNSISTSTSVPSNSVPSSRIRSALEEAAREQNIDKRLRRLEELGRSLALPEMAGALGAGKSLKELRERMVFNQAALIRWGDLEPEQAFHYTAQLPEGQLKANTLRETTAKFAGKSPERAAAAAASMTLGRARNDAIELIANIWAHTNASGAMQWVEKLPTGFARNAARDAILYVWVQSDPITASSRVEKLEPGSNRNNLISNTAYNWAAIDPQAAIRWTERLPDGPDKESAWTSLAESWANRDPKAAAAFALKLPIEETRTLAAANVAIRWARQHPRSAADWIWNCSDAGVRGRGLKEVVDLWTGVDALDCSKWIETLPAGSDRDQVIALFVQAGAMWAPAIAAREALLIGQEDTRLGALDECLQRWRETDSSAAMSWLKEAKLPESFKERWLGYLANP